MKRASICSVLGSAIVLTGVGCGSADPPAAPQTGAKEEALAAANARGFNARGFNARGFNGRAFNARGFNGLSYNGRAFNGAGHGLGFHGAGASGLSFSGYKLVARRSELALWNGRANPQKLSLEALGGSVQMTARHPSDPTMDVSVRLSGPTRLPGSGEPIYSYLLEVFDPLGAEWVAAFIDDEGSPHRAIPLNGRWNIAPEDLGLPGGGDFVPDGEAITFAVREYTLAKCVELGYRPWVVGGMHQACVRAMRADYCGDGRSFTRDGTMIDLFDSRMILVPEVAPPHPGSSWEDEAEWTPYGASCLSAERIQDWAEGESPEPSCGGRPLSELYSPSCNAVNGAGRAIWSDELIRTRHEAPAAP